MCSHDLLASRVQTENKAHSQNVRFQKSGFKTSETSDLQNVRFTKHQVFKTFGCKTSHCTTVYNVPVRKVKIFMSKEPLLFALSFPIESTVVHKGALQFSFSFMWRDLATFMYSTGKYHGTMDGLIDSTDTKAFIGFS